MEEILIAVVPALLAFLGAVWKSNNDLKKQEIIHNAKIAEIKAEAAEKREQESKRFEERLKELKTETDEALRKADAEIDRKFMENFTNPTDLANQIEGLTKGIGMLPKLEDMMDDVKKWQSRKGWK